MASGVNNRVVGNGGGRFQQLRQRYTANRQQGRGRIASAINALRGRT